MTESNPHSAAGQAAGYFYQIERAVARLAEAENSAMVAIEKEDDVSVRMDNGRMILEQDKHTQGDRHPFTDGSKALWNTLDIWSAAIASKKIDPTMCSFFMVTNAAIVGGIVTQLSNATDKDAVNQALVDLRAAACKAPRTSEAVAMRVVARDNSILAPLIEGIVLVYRAAIGNGSVRGVGLVS